QPLPRTPRPMRNCVATSRPVPAAPNSHQPAHPITITPASPTPHCANTTTATSVLHPSLCPSH
ncbi:hypothetical protein CYLTODRAFT_361701, partial [Cylindrobasidium torrendii FP15055 ss-10]